MTFGTEDQCQSDCSSPTRPVGPTRPWDAQDPLGNSLYLTRPYPYHIAANDVVEHRYDFQTFCRLGCTFFFGLSYPMIDTGDTKTSTLSQCRDLCDEEYGYKSSTPPYNDLAEISRLECHDGCLMALKRCRPGHYCTQPSFYDDGNAAADDDATGNSIQYEGGNMIPCPPGTFRDTSYEAVTECTPCPPNYYREGVKGQSLSSCSPCPAGTSAVDPGNTSITDCVRCKAGTFSTKASSCMCITPQACTKVQLPPPADAEKKDTLPYIGRW